MDLHLSSVSCDVQTFINYRRWFWSEGIFINLNFSFAAPGYSVGSLVSSSGSQLYVAGAPRFNHTGKVVVFTLKNSGNLTMLQNLLGEQVFETQI